MVKLKVICFILFLTLFSITAPARAMQTPVTNRARLAFTGDLMVHQWQADLAFNRQTGEYCFHHEFEHVKNDLLNFDFVIGNLETTLSGTGFSCFPRFSVPDSYGEAIKAAGFNFVTTANNHIYDKGYNGLVRTLDTLDALGIYHTGAFRSLKEQAKPFIIEINEITFALLSFSYSTNGIPVPRGREYSINLLDKNLIWQQVQAAKDLNPDFIIVLPHMGVEYSRTPSHETRQWAEFMLESGADIVIITHPHVIQHTEMKEDGKFIAWSLGNFISSQRTLPRDYGMILAIEFEKTGTEKAEIVKISFIPTWVKFINNRGVYDIQVLPVYDALLDYTGENRFLLRPQDARRLANVNREITKIILGHEIEAQREYVIYDNNKNNRQ